MRMKKGFNDTRYRAVCGDRARTVVYVYPCMGYYLCVPPYTRYDGRVLCVFDQDAIYYT